MKYIRTKDGVIHNILKELGVLLFKDGDISKDISTLEKEQVEGEHYWDDCIRSNNLEDLIDEVIVKGVPNRTFVIDVRDYKSQGLTLKDYIGFLFAQYSNVEIFGAIYITLPNGEPRLEPVTKMNEKEEWTLL